MSKSVSRVSFIALLLSSFVAACGTSNSNVIEIRSIEADTALVMSADNRAIIVAQKGPDKLVCAEPQPDAIRAIAREFAGALEAKVPLAGGVTPEGAASVASATREAMGELGKRTPAIQLMRDLLYRACEARINGIIRPGETFSITLRDGSQAPYSFDQLTVDVIKQIDNMTVALHAVDGLTSIGNVGKVTISASASGNTTATPGDSGASAPATMLNATVGGGGTQTLSAGAAKEIASAVVNVVKIALNDKQATPHW